MKSRRQSLHIILQTIGLLVLTVILFAGCNNFSFYSELDGEDSIRINGDGPEPDTLTITPVSAVIPVNTNYAFTASGGTEPYVFSLAEGDGSIDPQSGVYSADSVPGSATVRVTDEAGTVKTAQISVVEPGQFTISPTSLVVYTNTNTVFSAVGGVSPYTFSVPPGSGSIGPLSGIYTAPSIEGTAVVRVTDGSGSTSDATVTVLEPFRISPHSVTITTGNSYTFTASGGKTPYFFDMQSGSGTVNSATGVYTAPGSAGTDIVRVSDDMGNSDTATVTVVPPSPLQISPTSVTVTTGNSHTFTASGGETPYSFGIQSGSGSINASGVYTAPGVAGTAIVRVEDNAGITRDATVTIASPGPLSINPGTATVEQNTTFDFSAEGGTPQYSYWVVPGSLGSINSDTGRFTAPSTIGTSTVRVTDEAGATSDASVEIAPAAPSGLDADGDDVGNNPQIIELTWTDNSSGEAGFKIERSVSGGAFSEITTVGPNTTAYVDGSLSPNTTYGYRVRSYSGTVHSGYSNESYDIPNPND